MRGLVQEHLVGRRRLLEPARALNDVAGQDMLVGAGLLDDQRAGGDPGPNHELDPPAGLESRVQGLLGRLAFGRRSDGLKGVIPARAAQPEDGQDGIADDLLDDRAARSKTARMSSK